MAQYTTGTVSVTNGSQTVTGSGTLFQTAALSAGDLFTVIDSNVPYIIGSVDSETQVTLSANYAGATASGLSYAVHTSFTSNNGWPYPEKGDVETATILKRSLIDIDEFLILGSVPVTGVITTTSTALIRDIDTDVSVHSGGTSINLGAATWLYGPSHATKAEDIEFKSSGVDALVFDFSADTWDFQGSEVIAGGFTGNLDGILGANTPAAATVTTLTASSNTYPVAKIIRPSNAVGSQVVALQLKKYDSGSNEVVLAEMVGNLKTATAGAVDGEWKLSTMNNGSLTTAITVDENQNTTFAGTIDITDGQMKFPATQNASSDANTLDDYEERTWTPGLDFGGGSVGMTFSYQEGTYTKIGNVVRLTGVFLLTAKGSSTGTAFITGLPFTPGDPLPSASIAWGGSSSFFSGMASLNGNLTITIGDGSTSASIRHPNASSNISSISQLSHANFTDTSLILFDLVYTT